MDLNWDALGAIGELVGAACVVVTLFYLSVQLRQNTEQVRHSAVATEIAAYQDLIGRITDLNALRISDPELTDLLLKAESDPSTLTDNERSRFGVWIASLLRHGDMAFFLYERGVIDRERARSSLGPLAAVMRSDGFRVVLERLKARGTFSPSYIEFLEAVIREKNA